MYVRLSTCCRATWASCGRACWASVLSIKVSGFCEAAAILACCEEYIPSSKTSLIIECRGECRRSSRKVCDYMLRWTDDNVSICSRLWRKRGAI